MSRRQTTTRLLLNETPIIILPTLAKQYSVVEAALLQQIHYMNQQPKLGLIHQGYKWVYNTLSDWQQHFSCFSRSTIERAIARLKATGLIVIEKLNPYKTVRTNYYRIDYSKLPEQAFEPPSPEPTAIVTESSLQPDDMHHVSVTQSIPSTCGDVLSKKTHQDSIKDLKETSSQKNQSQPIPLPCPQPANTMLGSNTPTHQEPSAEQLDQLSEPQRQLWQQLRRMKVDIAHNDPQLSFWLRRNLVYRMTQTLIDRKAHQQQSQQWHTLAALGLTPR